MLQQIAVAAAVVLACAYSAWTLMPAAWRSALRRRLGRAVPAAADAGGCSGCGGGCAPTTFPPGARHGTAVVTLHRRPGTGARQPP